MRVPTLDDAITVALIAGGSVLFFRWVFSGGDPETMTGPWWHRNRYHEWAALKRPWGVTKHCLGFIVGCAVVLAIGAAIKGGSAVDTAVAVPIAAFILIMPFAVVWDLVAGRIRARRAAGMVRSAAQESPMPNVPLSGPRHPAP